MSLAKNERKDDLASVAKRAFSLLDYTLLGDADTLADINALCAKASQPEGTTAAVCVWPRFVAHAKRLLEGTGVKVAAVANFPDGSADIDRAVGDTRAIGADGGDEVDVVFPYRALMSGDETIGRDLVRAVKTACGEAKLKVIIESGVLESEELIRRASELSIAGGADFLKTSTGKVAVSATPEAARIMMTVIKESGRSVGFKAAGGIRDTETAATYLAIADEIMGDDWATPDTFRFGASGVLDALLADMRGTDTVEAGEGY